MDHSGCSPPHCKKTDRVPVMQTPVYPSLPRTHVALLSQQGKSEEHVSTMVTAHALGELALKQTYSRHVSVASQHGIEGLHGVVEAAQF